MVASSGIESGLQRVNGADLYVERQGSGPPVLVIPGMNDARSIRRTAAALAEACTVIAYDRRGYSHSPRPAGWTSSSIAEQVADAAGLIRALGIAPCIVLGFSAGGTIGLELGLRHPDLVTGLALHEPFIPAYLGEQLPEVLAQLDAALRPVLTAQGPRAAVEMFVPLFAGRLRGRRPIPRCARACSATERSCSGSTSPGSPRIVPTTPRWRASPARCGCSSAQRRPGRSSR
ncbi:MAG: alpha/beta fold hydrolase [Chloroflexi bacterium]|nr:alpha/beta fold hydrolase [Chloroflexota bacterium]